LQGASPRPPPGQRRRDDDGRGGDTFVQGGPLPRRGGDCVGIGRGLCILARRRTAGRLTCHDGEVCLCPYYVSASKIARFLPYLYFSLRYFYFMSVQFERVRT
jgi:hypothetical protein